MTDTHWIFGYGSIIWNTGFEYVERRPAYLDGFTRRFWQASTDHRGTPDNPGRVVTLVPRPDEGCWGVIYRVEDQHWDQVLTGLDHREKGGYEQQQVIVHQAEDQGQSKGQRLVPNRQFPATHLTATTYIADENNEHYLGHAELPALAAQILNAHGPSGSNKAYILKLDAALSQFGIVDDHVRELAEQVRLRHNLTG